MTNANTHRQAGPNDITSRLSNLHVDDRFPNHQAHPNPGVTSHHPSLNPTSRSFAYPDQSHMDIYNFYQKPLLPANAINHGPQLDPPFSPHTPALAFGYAPPAAADMAGLMQNEFEYGLADPYGVPAGGVINHGLGLGLGMDPLPMSLQGHGLGQAFRPRDTYGGQQRGHDGQRSPVKSAFRQGGGGGGRDSQSGHNHQYQQGGRKTGASDAGMMSPPQSFGGPGTGYWSANNGAFVERGKKSQIDAPRTPHTVLRPHAAFSPHYNPSNTPLYASTAIRNAYGQYTPDTPSLHHLVPAHYGQQYSHPLLRYQANKPRRFDDSPRSALLEDFRLNKSDRNWGLSEIFGHIIEFSGDQHGSRLIQAKIEHASDQDRQMMYLEILPNAPTLMQDVFGNYCIQKFFDYGTEEQVRGLAEQMRGRVYELSMQMYGCRVVQKALDKVGGAQKLFIISELEGKIVECVKSANANHVIQRIIQSDPPKSVPDAFLGHAQDLSVHSFGCRVLQKAVESLPDDHKRELLEELQGCARTLIEDAFGNYVVQSMIVAAGPEHRQRVIKIVRGQVWNFSRHKFASNVVEKAILHAEPNDKRELVYELVNVREDGTHRVHAVLRDPFANFVLQTCLKSAERPQRQQLLDLIVPLMSTIRHTPPGKRLDQIITEMQTEGFTVSFASPAHTHSNLEFQLPPNPLRAMAHASEDTGAYSDAATETDGQLEIEELSISTTTPTDLSRSGSSGRGALSPDVKPAPWDGKRLRPTASAPPPSDRPVQERMGVPMGRAGSPVVKKEELVDLLA